MVKAGISLGGVCFARPAITVGDDEEAISVVLDPVGAQLTYNIRCETAIHICVQNSGYHYTVL